MFKPGQPRKPKTPYSREIYELLVQSHRNVPGNHTQASKAAGCGVEMARRCYYTGWPTVGGWAVPIQQRLKEEAEEAQRLAEKKRSAHESKVIEEAEQARARGIEAKAEEERIVQISRKEVLNFNAIAISLVPAMKKLADGISSEVMSGKYHGDPVQAFKFLREFSLLLQRGLQAAAMAIELSRLDSGRPTLIVEEIMSWDPERCQQEIVEAMEVLQRAQAKGIVPAGLGPNGKPVIDSASEHPKPAPKLQTQAQRLLHAALDHGDD